MITNLERPSFGFVIVGMTLPCRDVELFVEALRPAANDHLSLDERPKSALNFERVLRWVRARARAGGCVDYLASAHVCDQEDGVGV